MERKEKRKRRVSIFTVFIFLALVVTMSVIVISGVNKSNALEESGTRKIIIKIDFSVLKEDGIIDQTEIDNFLNKYMVGYKGTENETTGVYEAEIESNIKKLCLPGNAEYEMSDGINTFETYYASRKPYYILNLSDDIEEYNVIARRRTDTKKIIVKIDFAELIKDKGITEQSEIEELQKSYLKINSFDGFEGIVDKESLNSDYIKLEYLGNEKDTIGIYEIEMSNRINYIQVSDSKNLLQMGKFELSNEEGVLEYVNRMPNYNNYLVKLVENIEEYNLKITVKDTRKITIKMDFKDYIEDKRITEQSEIDTLLENYSSRFRGKTTTNNSLYIDLKGIYLGTENSTIGIYEVEVINDIEYIQITKPYDSEYMDISHYRKYDMTIEGKPLEIVNYYGNSNNEYVTFASSVYALKLSNEINEYNINLERRKEITINLDDNAIPSYSIRYWSIRIEDNTNKILYNQANGGLTYIKSENDISTYKAYLSKYFEYDIIIYELYGRNSYSVFEDGMLLSRNEKGESYSTKKSITDKDEYNFKLKFVENSVFSNIKWENKNKVRLEYEAELRHDSNSNVNYVIFIEKLDERFTISDEYENDPKWLIVDEKEIINDKILEYYEILNEYVPEYICANLLNYDGYYKVKGDIYNIYIKDKNILYSLVSQSGTEDINLVCKENKIESGSIFNFETKVFSFSHNLSSCGYGKKYEGNTMCNKKIKYEEEDSVNIIVNKLINEIVENKIYYVGLFENESDEVTDKIYNMDVVNSKGSTTINIENYDKNKNYYVYEVDKNGKKIIDNNTAYSKNKVFENSNIISRHEILSDKELVSAGTIVFTDSLDSEAGKVGEEKYIDNKIKEINTKEDTVTITSKYKDIIHIVKYESENGGSLEGDLQEAVKDGEKPVNIPKIILDEGYEFEKWVVIKDGEEIEVNPSEYVVYEDTTFIAKYKKIEVVEKTDTSDINIWKYVGIAMISVLVIAIVVIILIVNKKRKISK